MTTSEFKSYGLSQDIIADNSLTYIAQNPTNAIDPMALKSLFYTEDWVYIVIDKIASMISSQYLRVVRDVETDGKKVVEPAEGHPVQAKLERPNADQDYHSWMYGLVVDEVLMGNVMIWRAPQADELFQLPSELTRIDLNSDGSVKNYRITYGNEFGKKSILFQPDEVCHIKRPNPSSRIFGLSPFIPASKAVAFNRYTSEYLINFYQKGAQPGLVLELAEGTNEQGAKRLLRSIETAYTGRANQRKTIILPKGVSANQFSHTLADQQLIDYINSNRETIINILQVPKHELGLDSGQSLGAGGEYQQARANFWRGQLKSIMRRIAGSLTRFYQDELGDHYLEFDLSDVDVLQEDEDRKAQLAEKLLSTHTINEVRQMLYGLDGVPEGDVIRGTQQQQPMPQLLSLDQTLGIYHDVEKNLISRDAAIAMLRAVYGLDQSVADKILGEQKPALPSATVENKDIKRFEIFKKSAGDWFERTDQQFEDAFNKAFPRMFKTVISVFSAQAEKVADVLGKYKSIDGFETKELPDKRKLKKEIREALDSLEQQYLDGYAPNLEVVLNATYDSTVYFGFNLEDQIKLEAIKERNAERRRMILEERGLRNFAWMDETTTENIMQIIENGIAEKLSIIEIQRNIVDNFSDIENIQRRAEVIARTEVLTAASVAQAAAMKDAERVFGKVKKMWINAGDERVRGPGGIYPNAKDDHRKLQGQVRFSDEKFENGLMYPRDPNGEPYQTIQCRCRIVTVAAEDADAIGFGDLDVEHTGG